MHSKYEKVVYWFVFLQLILTLSFYSRGAELTDVSVLRKLVNVEVLSLRYEKCPKNHAKEAEKKVEILM